MARRPSPRRAMLRLALALAALPPLPAAGGLAHAASGPGVVSAAAEPAPAAGTAAPAASAAAVATPPTDPAAVPAAVEPAAVPSAAEPAPHAEVTVSGDRLTVRVVDMPLDEVLRRIAEGSGARLEGGLHAPGPVSAEIDAVPLQEGLERLLGEQNFLLAYRPDGRLSRLVLLGGPQSTAPATPAPPLEPEPAAEPADGPGVLQRTVTLPPGPARSQLGRERATLQELLDLALRSSDASLRMDAIRAGIRAVDEQPELTAAVSAALGNVDDATLAIAARSVAGEHADQVLSQLVTFSKTPALRQRGIRIMQHLVAGPQ